jgi:uncharacterized protein YjbI with pentapeptide repeats
MKKTYAKYQHVLYILFAFIAGSLVSIATTTVLAHGGDTSKLHSCVDDTTGAMRMVGENDTCPSGEHNVDWDKNASPSANVGFPFMCSLCLLTPFENKFAGHDFSHAQIIKGDFTAGDFTEVNFNHAYLSEIDAQQAVFEDADFSYANIIGGGSGEGFRQTNFTNANFSHATLTGRFPEANLSNASFSYASINGPDMTDSNFTGTNFSHVTITGGIFRNANFSNADLTNATISDIQDNPPDGYFNNADFTNADLSNATITNASFRGAKNMDQANLTGITWINTNCPNGSNSDDDNHSCDGNLNP